MRLVASGDAVFLRRFEPLFRALEPDTGPIARAAGGNLAEWLPLRVYNALTRGTTFHDRLLDPDPNPAAFAIRSRMAARKLARVSPPPDLVFHVFCTFAPVWGRLQLPYVLYLDYTMAQASREHPPWAAFRSARAQERWHACESDAYSRARHVFTMSDVTRAAVIADYGVSAEKVSVVGSGGGNFDRTYQGEKAFGSERILFDGSDLYRKGGDVLFAAVALARRLRPRLAVTVVGNAAPVRGDGVVSLAPVLERDRLRDLFLSAEHVVAPTRCDPFPGFVIEAMNYGLPCIVTRASGLSHVIEREAAGLVVVTHDPEALAHAIERLLGSREAMLRSSANGRRVVAEHLNWQAVASAMLPVLLPQSRRRLSGERGPDLREVVAPGD
jgi:glycosyltransferase involved in cell wall biosynthesis